jgi:Na+-driven multidrug efflux pump
MLGIFATILHVIISAVLIAGIGPFPQMGVIGAALGSVIAPGVSVVIALSFVASGRALLKPPPQFTLLPRLDILKIVARIGLPTGIQGVLLNLGGVALIYFINRLPTDVSPAALAAYTICYNQIFSLITWTSFGLRSAASTVMGQNIGAGNPQRGKKAVRMAANLGFLWALAIGSLYWAIPEQLLAIFDATSEPLLTYATSLLHYLLWSGLVLAPALALTGGIQGAGATMIPMFIALATQIVLLLGLCLYFDLAGLLTPANIWLSILICHIVRLLLTCAVFQTEGWIHTKVELHETAPEEEPLL